MVEWKLKGSKNCQIGDEVSIKVNPNLEAIKCWAYQNRGCCKNFQNIIETTSDIDLEMLQHIQK